jgi:hypothetical protein
MGRGQRRGGRPELAREVGEGVGERPEGIGRVVDQGVHGTLGGRITGVAVVSQQLMGGIEGGCARPLQRPGEGVERPWVQALLGRHAYSLWPQRPRIAKLRTAECGRPDGSAE